MDVIVHADSEEEAEDWVEDGLPSALDPSDFTGPAEMDEGV